jgi:hypothetical protein
VAQPDDHLGERRVADGWSYSGVAMWRAGLAQSHDSPLDDEVRRDR